MKRIKFLSIFIALLAIAPAAGYSFDLKTAIKNAADKAKESKGSTIGDAIGGLLSSDKVTVTDLDGSWTYKAPAVTLKSSNALKKAGGAAATSMIEEKLAPYYKTAGFDKMTLTVNSADSTFTMKVRGINLSGTITANVPAGSEANMIFKFKALKKLSLGSLNAYITKSATGTIDLTFDVSRLITLVEKVGSITKNSTVTSVTSLLKSYDGLTAGFELEKTSSN